MTDEEALLVVVGVDEPQPDRIRPVGLDLASLWPEDIDAFDHDLDLASADRLDRNVGLAEHDEQIAGAGVLQLAGHMQVGVHARLQDRNAADAVEFGRMGVEIEGASDSPTEVAEGHAVRPVGVVLVELGDRLLIGRCR